MRKTIYTICILIILVVAAFLVSPYFLGGQTQANFHKQIAAFNKKSPYITITPESYQRHWFSSDAQVKVNFHTPSFMTGPEPFSKSYTYNAVIKHGPLFFLSTNGKLSIHWGAGAILIKGDSKDFDGVVAVTLGWHNQIEAFADIPHLVLHDPKNNNYTITNLKLTTDQNGNNVRYTLSIPKISAQLTENNSAQINLNNLKLTASGHDVNLLWVGNGNFSIDNITVGLNQHGIAIPIADIKNITTNLETNLSSDKTKINSSINFNIDSVSAIGKTIKPITFSYSVDGVDATAYQQLMMASEALQSNTAPTQQQSMQLATAAIKLIECGFTVKINKIYVGLPKELASSPLSAKAQLNIKPINNLMQQLSSAFPALLAKSQGHPDAQLEQKIAQALPQVMGDLSKSISANGQASIPQSLVKQVLLHTYTKQLMQMAASGHTVSQTPQELSSQAYDYLTKNKMLLPNNDGSAKVKFTFKNGQLLVNGEKPALDLPKPSLHVVPTAPEATQITPAGS